MKKILIAALMSLTLFACKKDSPASTPVDERDKFVGNWTGSGFFKVPDLQIDEYLTGYNIIVAKNTSIANKLAIFDSQRTLSASVGGTTYNYESYTQPFTDATTGETFSLAFSGNGTISSDGRTITESGTIIATDASGITYNGSWGSLVTKQ